MLFPRLWLFAGATLIIVAAVIGAMWWTRATPAPSAPSSNNPALHTEPTPGTVVHSTPTPPRPAATQVNAQDIPGTASQFTFAAEIPSPWKAEAIADVEAISLYDPALPGSSNLEKSQIFIRYFTANDFLTLSTVTIHTQTPLSVAGQSAVRYDIEKKPNIANFNRQPLWRNERHIVTDVRVSNQNPSVFYVIAKRPDLSAETYNRFLETLVLDTSL